jgi:N-acetylmuramoyl-L-alanine amidase
VGREVRIIGPASARRDVVVDNLLRIPDVHTRFINDMFPRLWDIAEAYRVDPVGVVAQAAKETGYGQYRGKVKPEFFNTAGLKITDAQMKMFPGLTDNDNPLAHAMFAGWHDGVTAHVQHLRAYSGWLVEMDDDMIVDPRYYLVAGKHAVEDFYGLSGHWAPALDYGARLVQIAKTLQGAK